MGVALVLQRRKNVWYVPWGRVREEFLRRQDVRKRELLTSVGKFKSNFRDQRSRQVFFRWRKWHDDKTNGKSNPQISAVPPIKMYHSHCRIQ